jgi:hypothetical protein
VGYGHGWFRTSDLADREPKDPLALRTATRDNKTARSLPGRLAWVGGSPTAEVPDQLADFACTAAQRQLRIAERLRDRVDEGNEGDWANGLWQSKTCPVPPSTSTMTANRLLDGGVVEASTPTLRRSRPTEVGPPS